jgi:DNA-binding IclR family transcriptional regulator
VSQNVNEFNNGILENLFSSRAIAQILDFFFDHKEFDYPPSEIAKKTGLSFRTIFRELPSLERNQLIFNNRRIGKTNMYKLNTDFEAVALLERFVLEMSQLRPSKETTSQDTNGDISESEINLS